MRKLEAIVKSWILSKIGFARPRVVEIDGKCYLKRYSTYMDQPVYMAMVQCYRFFGMHIEEIVLDRHNFEPFVNDRPEVEEFIIQHEIAHIELGHHKLELHLMNHRERLQLEIDADEYAGSKVGYDIAYSSIKELNDLFCDMYGSLDDEVVPRLNALSKMIKTA